MKRLRTFCFLLVEDVRRILSTLDELDFCRCFILAFLITFGIFACIAHYL